MARKSRKTPKPPWIGWLLASVGYLIQYGLLVFPAAIATQMQTALKLNPFEFGIFTSAFLYPYILLQIPVGMLFDRCNTKLLFISSTSLLTLGCLLLYFSHGLVLGVASRLLMGFGGSAYFVGTLHLSRIWFSGKLFPLLVGLTEAMSGLGSMIFITLFSYYSEYYNWRSLVLITIVALLILNLLMWFFIQDDKSKVRIVKLSRWKNSLSILLRKKSIWICALYTGFGFAHFSVLANTWNIFFFENYFHLSETLSVVENSLVVIGFTLGCPLCGWLSKYIKNIKIMMASSLIQVISLMLLYYFSFHIYFNGFIFFILGISTGSVVLIFEVAKKFVLKSIYGISGGILNMFFGGIGILITPAVGYFYEATQGNIQIAVFPLVLTSGIAVLLCFMLFFIKGRSER